jgi:hypothetical protein
VTSSLRNRDALPEPRPSAPSGTAGAALPGGARATGAAAGTAQAWATGRWSPRRGGVAEGTAHIADASAVPPSSWRGFGWEVLGAAAVAVAAWFAARALVPVLPAPRTAAVLELAAGTGAAVMTAVAGRVSGSRRAVRMAGAVAGYTVVGPLGAALEPSAGGLWPVVQLVGLLGVVLLLVSAVRRRSPARRPLVVVAAAVLACVVAAVGVLGGVAPTLALAPGVTAAALLAVWAGAGAAGLLALVAGLRRDRPLLRRIGLGFALLATAHAVSVSGVAAAVPVAMHLAAAATLLGAAVPFLFSAVRGLWEQREAYRVEAESLRAALDRPAED